MHRGTSNIKANLVRHSSRLSSKNIGLISIFIGFLDVNY